MSLPCLKILLPLLLICNIALQIAGDDAGTGADAPTPTGDEEYHEFEGQWCVADEQTGYYELLGAINWACGEGGADCTAIQENQTCYEPNTVVDHASYAFNAYYQKYKKQGATCNFNNAGMITELDPSHGNCHYDYFP